jgi:G3E family GTPase
MTQMTQTSTVDRIPVTLLTGFLGAGKTTLLNHWIHQPGMAGVAVLVNEFGEVGIDHHVVDAATDQTVLLDSGCLCCSMQGDLVLALRRMFDRVARGETAPITRVVIETTGLADPIPVLYTLMEEPFVCARFVCDAVITAISGLHGQAQLQAHSECHRQVMVADRLLITKCDQATTADLQGLEQALQSLNPQAPRTPVRHGTTSLDVLLRAAGLYGRHDLASSLQAWLGNEIERHSRSDTEGDESAGRYLLQGQRHGRRASGPRSFVTRFERPVSWFGLAVTMGQILRRHGPALLRVKGLVRVAGDEAHPRVVQCVQEVAYPPVRLPRWPDTGAFDDGCGRLVFITQGLDSAGIDAIRTALENLPADVAALRGSAGDLGLPTRCWLAQRVPVQGPGAILNEGWLIQPRRFQANSSHA